MKDLKWDGLQTAARIWRVLAWLVPIIAVMGLVVIRNLPQPQELTYIQFMGTVCRESIYGCTQPYNAGLKAIGCDVEMTKILLLPEDQIYATIEQCFYQAYTNRDLDKSLLEVATRGSIESLSDEYAHIGELFDLNNTSESDDAYVKVLDNLGGVSLIHVRLPAYTPGNYNKVERELMNYPDAEYVFIDLRGDEGGNFDTANDFTDLFLERDTSIVTVENSRGGRLTYSATEKMLIKPTAKIIFAFDRNTASASEITIRALRASGKIMPNGTIGEPTFGKGIMQRQFKLDGVGSFQLTIARLIDPMGISYHGIPVEPDIELTDDPTTLKDEVVEAVKALVGRDVTSRNLSAFK